MKTRPLTFAQACARYPHRFTMTHVPQWAHMPMENGRFYAPQYRDCIEWYEKTRFPGEAGIPTNSDYCHSTGQSWPLGRSLAEPYRAAPTLDAIAEAAAEAAILADTAPAHAREFWRRLAGSLRKAATVPR